MPLSVWTKPSGYNLGRIPGYGYTVTPGKIIPGKEYVIISAGTADFTNIGAPNNNPGTVFVAKSAIAGTGSVSETSIREENTLDKELPVTNDTGVVYSVIAGQLPLGLRLEGNRIVGTPRQVADTTTFTFCIRASLLSNISDRTFKLIVDGPDDPTFISSPGLIPIGIHDQLYALDRTYVEYQIEAFDLDTAAGQKLNYFIASGDGSLPPGLTLSDDGLISGFISPSPKISISDGLGTYDETYFDKTGYDFARRPSNGYETYLYDRVTFDYNSPTAPPTTLNLNYQFKVTLTDGNSYAQRIFKIFVVGDDQFRADNTTPNSEVVDFFTTDVSYLREPSWLTKPSIGLFRANNYLTVPLALYDSTNCIFQLEYTNQEVKVKTRNILPTDNVLSSNDLVVDIGTSTNTIQPGYYFVLEGVVENALPTKYKIYSVTQLSETVYRCVINPGLEVNIPNETEFYIGTLSTLPKGTSFDIQTATIYGIVPYQPAITVNYNFTISAIRIGDKGDYATTSRTFNIGIIGEIDSVITWNTNSNLGTIAANLISTLNVSASSTITDAVVVYSLVSGKLPPGLFLNTDGEIVGKVNQFYDEETGTLGLTRFYDLIDSQKVFTEFDNGATTFDKEYTFTVEAKDQYDYSATTRTFTLTVSTPNSIKYSNIRAHPFLKISQRDSWKSFINDSSIFVPGNIYRINDPNFGVQTSLAMLIYPGIETKEVATYISAIGLNHKRKRFAFGSIKLATAYLPGTKKAVYEVVYAEIKDLSEPNGKRLPNTIKVNGLQSNNISVDNSMDFWSTNINTLSINSPNANRPEPILTVDSTGYQSSNYKVNTYFPNSITNWRERLKYWQDDAGNGFSRERNYLPLWMRSIQPGANQELGFVLAVPICYCKVGLGTDILANIKFSGFDFKTLDYTIDRYIIDAVEEQNSDKYLVFKNDRITV